MEGENSHGIQFLVWQCQTIQGTITKDGKFYTSMHEAKLDELCVLVEIHNPDVISIVESWLCANKPDSQISISGYHVLHKD